MGAEPPQAEVPDKGLRMRENKGKPAFDEQAKSTKLKAKSQEIARDIADSFGKLTGLKALAVAGGKEGQALYEEATTRLAKAGTVLAEINNKLETKLDLYIATLQKNDLFKKYPKNDKIFMEMLVLEPDPKILLELIKIIYKATYAGRGGNKSERTFGRTTALVKKFGSAQAVISIFKNTKAPDLLANRILDICMDEKVQSLAEVEKFLSICKTLGIDHRNITYFFEIEGISPSEEIVDLTKQLLNSGVGVYDIFVICKNYKKDNGDKLDMVELKKFPDRVAKLKALNQFDIDTLLDPAIDGLCDYAAKLADQGMRGPLVPALFECKIPLTEAPSYRALSELAFEKDSLIAAIRIQGPNPAPLVNYVKAFNENFGKRYGVQSYEILGLYRAEKDLNKALAYIEKVRKLGFKFPAGLLYETEPSTDILERNIDSIKELIASGVAEPEAMLLANLLPAKPVTSLRSSIDNLSVIDGLPSNLSLQEKLILLTLVDGNTEEDKLKAATDLYEEIKMVKNPLLMRYHVVEAISYFKANGLPTSDLVKAAPEFADLEDVVLGYNFQKRYGFPTRTSKVVIITSAETADGIQISSGIVAAAKYCKDDPAKVAILKSVFEHTEGISKNNVDEFLADPALPFCEEVYRKFGMTPEGSLRIGRDIFLAGTKKAELEAMGIDELVKLIDRVKEVRRQYENVPLYENREVVVLKHSEKWGPTYTFDDKELPTPPEMIGKDGFFTPEDVEDIKISMGEGAENRLHIFTLKTDTPTADDLRKVKGDELAAIVNTKSENGATFILDGHGSKMGAHFYGGQIAGEKPKVGENVEFISDEELAGAIKARIKEHGYEATSKDIYLSSGCYSHTYFRRVEAILRKDGIKMPIVISGSEYGQYGFGGFNREESLFKKVMGLGQKGVTLKYVMDHEGDYQLSNPSMYVTDPATGKPVQVVDIAKADESLKTG